MRRFEEIPHRKILFSVILLTTLIVYRYSQPNPSELHELSGITMGVVPYSIVISTNKSSAFTHKLNKDVVNPELIRLNNIFSTFVDASEISNINKTEIGVEIAVSKEMYEVLQISKEVHEKTGGSFDPTLGALIELWGFGKKTQTVPDLSEEEIRQTKENIGYEHIELLEGFKIRKNKNVQLNLSAVAKGYVVDCVGVILEANGISDFLIEIGGEIYTKGQKPDGSGFIIGLEQPEVTQEDTWNPIGLQLKLKNKGLATSGNYRNYYIKDGKKYAHIIDPQTGYPAENNVVRVVVIAESCAYADAYATALMVMGKDKSLKLLNSEKALHGLITTRESDKFLTFKSDAFDTFLSTK